MILDPNAIGARAREEIVRPNLAQTRQFLAVMDVETLDESPCIARIDEDFAPDTAAVYFPIRGERFFLVVNVDTRLEGQAEFTWVEAGHRLYLSVTSERLTFAELAALTAMKPLSGWSAGDRLDNRKHPAAFSLLKYEPIACEAYGLEEKLDSLLTDLEKDRSGVTRLAHEAEACIAVCRHHYIDGNMGVHLERRTIDRLASLGLSLDIDTYTSGTPLREDDEE